ncbi:MAG TPA: hypothetical protein VHK06_04900 [Candidatus Limnocylindria bacterium]|nr:hypothetical protein [Candidatus Limnocylindria bacterium]
MAKRGGKAASRKSRQRPVRRTPPAARPAPSARAPTTTVDAPAPDSVVERRPESRPGDRRAPAQPAGSLYGSSVLSERARAEYHYVVRDLRNIGVLTAVIAVMLAVAFVLFRVVGLGA